jgi:hypothetical protein
MGRDTRTVAQRKSDQRSWYLKNADYAKMKSRVYRRQLKADPVRWAGYLAKARAYKRKKFGWKRVYRARTIHSGGLHDGLGNVAA